MTLLALRGDQSGAVTQVLKKTIGLRLETHSAVESTGAIFPGSRVESWWRITTSAQIIIIKMPEDATFRFPPGPSTLAGDAVFLRRSATRHVDLLIEASRDPEIIRWTRMPQDLSDATARALLDRWQDRVTDGSLRQYVISRGAKDTPVGLTSLILQDAADPWSADVVYWLLPSGRHLGLATGAVTLFLRWAFDKTALRRAVLYTLEGNEPSERVAQRCGFRFDRLVDDTREGRILRLNRWEFGVGMAPKRKEGWT